MDNRCVDPMDSEDWPMGDRYWCLPWWDQPALADDYGYLCEDPWAPVYPDYVGADTCRSRFGTCAIS